MTNEREKHKRVDEMKDRELAEHVLGRELVEKLHEEFDLRDTEEESEDEERDRFIPSD
jgi:hypothetical protein